MTLEEALAALRAHVQDGRAADMAAYHKAKRVYLGVSNVDINALTKLWRQTLTLEQRVALARDLWNTDIFEARLAAAKLLTQARLSPDGAVWDLIQSWVPQFDSWAIADHACKAGEKRLTADPSRLETIEAWSHSDHMWSRRAALVITLPWAKMPNPKPQDLETRERVLGWAARYVQDRSWFIQKAIGWWLRDHSKHDPERVRQFLDAHGADMKAFARKEAMKYLG